MGARIGKYAFNSNEQAKEKINDFLSESTEDLKSKHTFVKLGYEILEPAVYDDELNLISSIVIGEKYLVDVLWHNLEEHPFGWKSYAVDIEGEGVHIFSGLSYQENKIS